MAWIAPLKWFGAATERDQPVPSWMIDLCSATFSGHDEDEHACQCEDPLRPFKWCPAHQGRVAACIIRAHDLRGDVYKDGNGKVRR